MKRLLTCLFLVLGLGLVFSVNTNASDKSLKSAMKIDKKKKVKYSDYGSSFAYWQPGSTLLNNVQIKINDLRGDGNVYYFFEERAENQGKYYRVNEDFKVLSTGIFEHKKDGNILRLTEDNLKFIWKISLSSKIVDIKSKFYDYSGFRRYQLKFAINEEKKLRSLVKNYEDNKYVKVETNQDDISEASSLKSAMKIDKKEKVKYSTYDGTWILYWNFMYPKMNDLRGDGIVYYVFDSYFDKYYRVNKDDKVVSSGTMKYKDKGNIFELTEDNLKFFLKISISSQVADIKSKFYDYKGYRRYQFVLADTEKQKKLKSIIKNYEDNKYVKIETKQNDNSNNISDPSFKSALDIDKKEKIVFLNINKFSPYVFLLDDLRGNGPVYYVFNIDQYHRLDKNLNVISRGLYKFKGGTFELKEDKLKFHWKISLKNEVIDIKSKFYKYNGFKRYHFKKATKEQIKLAKQSVANFGQNQFAGYQDSDKNLNRLYTLIMEDKKFLKKNKYLKYSKKGEFDGKKIMSMSLAVFIDYEKELSEITKNIQYKKIPPFAWGWGYSTEDQISVSAWPTDSSGNIIKIVDYDKMKSERYRAIANCYQDVRKKKLSLRDGECIIVDFRIITGDSQNPIVSENYLIKERENKILIAKNEKELKKTKEQLAKEKKEEEAKKKQLLLAQKQAEEERKKQEAILAAKKKEEEKRKKELLLAQQAEDEQKKQELLLAQKKAEEERKKEELLLAQKQAEEEKKKQELIAQQQAEKEKQKEGELVAKLKEEEAKKIKELELAKKEAEKEFEKKKKELNVDKDSPEILVAEKITVSSQVYKLKGKVKDSSEFFLEIDGQPVQINEEGEFLFEGFIIDTKAGEELTLVAVDRWNNSTEKNVQIKVEIKETKVAKGYEKLLPNKVKTNNDKNKIAIIIGVEKYEYLVNLDAAFANRDANAFREYAIRALGVDPSNINLLIDKDANRPKILRALKLWLPKIGGENRDIYVFFAGHGLASDDGKNLYILPQDGDANLLEDTAIKRSEIVELLEKVNPKSVTMFFDTCYSGQTRNEETLVASLRPVRIVADEQTLPNNFTVFTASANDQTSGSINEAKHGMFSYYLMKGLEGKADENKDKQITNREMIAYLKNNVSKEAFTQNREQDPMLSGDPDQILMSYR